MANGLLVTAMMMLVLLISCRFGSAQVHFNALIHTKFFAKFIRGSLLSLLLMAPFCVGINAHAGQVATNDTLAGGAANWTVDGAARSLKQPAMTDWNVAAGPNVGLAHKVDSIYFYDPRLPDVEALLKAVPNDALVFAVSNSSNPLEEIGNIASRYTGLSAIHLLTHGATGELRFSGGVVGQLDLDLKSEALSKLGSSLALDGGVFLYGCNVAQNENGLDFVNKFSGLTNRAVSASSNLTGSTQKGGDWSLEVRVGNTNAVAFNAPAYENILWVTELEMAGWFGDTPALTPNPTITTDGATRFTTIGANITGGGGTFDIFNTGSGSAQRIRNDTSTSLATAQTGNFYFTSTLTPSSSITGQTISRFTFNQVSLNATAARASLVLFDTVTSTSQTINASFAIDGTATGVVVPITNVGMIPGRTYQLRVYMWNCAAAPAPNTCYIDNPRFFTQLNQNPVAQNDAFTAAVNTTVNGVLSANNGSGVDSDPEAQARTVTNINGASFTVGTGIALANGTLTVSNATTGAFAFVPTTGFNGIQTFTYTISDGFGGTATATVTITIGTPPRITLTKAMGTNRITNTDQFTVATRTGGVSGIVVNATANSTTTGSTNVVTAGTGTTGAYVANTGTDYTLTEAGAGTTNIALYSTRITCTDSAGLQAGLPSGAAYSVATGFTITPVASAVISCTLTNSKSPSISLTKALGSNRIAATDQFTVALKTGGVAGTVVNSTTNSTTTGATNVVTGGAGTTGTFTATAGTAYTLTEAASGTTNFAQYTSAITCTDSAGLQTGLPTGAAYTVASGLTITPVAGAVISCTLTNTAKAPTLAMTKALGANRVAASDQFTLALRTGGVAGTVVNVTTNSTTTGATNVVTGGTGTTGTFTAAAGTAYTLTEAASGTTNFTQYSSTITCTDSAGLQTGLPTGAAYSVATGLTITPVAGAVIACTLTNTPVTVINANNDEAALGVNSATGATAILNVLADNGFTTDTFGGAAATTASVTITASGALPTGVTLNANGNVEVAAGTTEGVKTFNYQICETALPTNCDIATVTFTVINMQGPTGTANPQVCTSPTATFSAPASSAGTLTAGPHSAAYSYSASSAGFTSSSVAGGTSLIFSFTESIPAFPDSMSVTYNLTSVTSPDAVIRFYGGRGLSGGTPGGSNGASNITLSWTGGTGDATYYDLAAPGASYGVGVAPAGFDLNERQLFGLGTTGGIPNGGTFRSYLTSNNLARWYVDLPRGATSVTISRAILAGGISTTQGVDNKVPSLGIVSGYGAGDASNEWITLSTLLCNDLDFADAPASYGSASHSIRTGLTLGAAATAETADYNDANASADADDGVVIPALYQSVTTSVPVSVIGASGYLQAWFDWNGDGDFGDAGEQVAADVQDGAAGDTDASANNVIQLAVAVPANAITTQTFARFRWSNTAGLASAGASTSGEVEDYPVTVNAGTTLTLTKVTDGGVGTFNFTGDSGGWVSQDIITAVSGTPVAGVTQTLNAVGTAITITEGAVAGFGMTGVTCTGTGGGTQPTVDLVNRTIAFSAVQTAAGSSIACTVSNIKHPTISMTKALGSSRVAATDQFSVALRTGGVAGTVVNVTTNSTTAGATNVVTGGTGTTGIFSATAGTAYTLTEAASGTTNFAQYTSAITCTDSSGLQTGLPSGAAYTVATGLTITPVAGAVISCTLTNTANNPVLTLAKSVVNTGGGTAIATAWTLAAAGPSAISGVTGAPSVTAATVNAGAYTLSETGGPADINGGAADYSASTFSCVVNGAGAVSGNSITLNLGDTTVCTITNTFVVDSTLTIDKRLLTGTTVPLVANQVITYEFEVTNSGNVPVTGVNIEETAFTGTGTIGTFTPPNGTVNLAPGASTTITATYTVSQADVDLLQ